MTDIQLLPVALSKLQTSLLLFFRHCLLHDNSAADWDAGTVRKIHLDDNITVAVVISICTVRWVFMWLTTLDDST